MSSPSLDDAPLAGIRVVDLSRLLPGPFASQILVDLGAEVIKVEDPHGGDYARYFPPLLSDGNAAAFHALNRGKKSVLLDLKKPGDKSRFLALLETADVLLETFRPGVLARLGMSYEWLLQRYPKLVVCSISGYGQTGPDRLRAGHDVNYLARAGVLGMMKEPQVLPVQVADIATGSLPAVIQILAALRRAERTGRGSVIDVSMTDGAYALLAMPLAKHAAEGGEIGAGKDLLSGSVPCYRVYRTADGFISVGALEPKFFVPLLEALGRPDLKQYQFSQGDEGHRDLEAIFAAKDNAHWKNVFDKLDCCVEVISPTENVAQRDPQLRARGLTVDVQVGDQVLQLPRTPVRMDGVRPSAQRGPALGEHTEQLLSRL